MAGTPFAFGYQERGPIPADVRLLAERAARLCAVPLALTAGAGQALMPANMREAAGQNTSTGELERY